MDTESLYANVPFEEGPLDAKFFLDKRPDCNPTSECILDPIKEVLTSDFILYGNYFLLHVSGVTMRSSKSPLFASLHVEFFEHNQENYVEVSLWIGICWQDHQTFKNLNS